MTRIFVAGDELLDSDTVFGVQNSLITDFVEQRARTPTPDGRQLGERSWCRARLDLALAPATVGAPPPTK